MLHDEALMRIEHKLDLLIQAMQVQQMMLPAPLPSLREKAQDGCPVCGTLHRFSIDTKSESVVLSCGCVPPIRAVPGISLVGLPTIHEKKEDSHGESSEAGSDDSGPDGASAAQRAQANGPGFGPGRALPGPADRG